MCFERAALLARIVSGIAQRVQKGFEKSGEIYIPWNAICGRRVRLARKEWRQKQWTKVQIKESCISDSASLIPPQYLVPKDDLHVLTLTILDHPLDISSPLLQVLRLLGSQRLSSPLQVPYSSCVFHGWLADVYASKARVSNSKYTFFAVGAKYTTSDTTLKPSVLFDVISIRLDACDGVSISLQVPMFEDPIVNTSPLFEDPIINASLAFYTTWEGEGRQWVDQFSGFAVYLTAYSRKVESR